ncbi:MAG: type II secretion system protein [Phycisphaerales bacterium]
MQRAFKNISHNRRHGSTCAVARRRTRAFSLVEIIVVMGIIGVLAAIILPVAATVRDKAHEAECQSNLRQIGAAIEVYRQNNDRLLPRAAPLPSGDPFSPPDGLNGALKRIIDPKSRVYLCPADDDPGAEVIGTSYFYVAGAFMFFSPPEPWPAARQVTKFFEEEVPNSIPIVWDAGDRHPIGTALPRNGLYIDGHVERVGEPFTIPGG